MNFMLLNNNNNNRITFRLIFISISILFAFHISNDLDLNSSYFVNTSALESTDNGKESIYSSYIFDASEYFEEDNFPSQNSNIHNTNNNKNKNNQLEQSEQQQKQQVYNQIKANTSSNSNSKDNKKYEFTSIESKNNEKNYNIESEYVTFRVVLNLENIEKEGFLRVIAYINGQSFKEDIQLSELDTLATTNKLDVKLKVLKDTELVSLSPPDEFHACAYHVKDIEKEYDSILYFDCNEADVQSSDGTNTVRLFKPSSMKYSDSKALYEQNEVDKTIKEKNDDEDDKVLIKIISPLGDRKNTKELKIAAMVRGQVQTEMIKDVQAELDKNNDDTITRTFTFDRKTDIGNIQIGDLFLACVTSEDLNPPEGQECEKRLVKKFNSANSLPAR